jgi:predicted enzyme related to lactoylglutathione lyase
MKINPVAWFEIYVEDMERAKKFYENVFDTRLQKMDNPELEMWGFHGEANRYGAPGALVKMSGFPAGRNSVLVYFSCDDCAVETTKVKESGGQVHKPKFSIGEYGFIALVVDSEGNMIGLHSMK